MTAFIVAASLTAGAAFGYLIATVMQAAARSDRLALPHQLPHVPADEPVDVAARLAPYMVRNGVPRQYRRGDGALDVDRVVALLQPCGTTPVGTCRLHKPGSCTTETPCCGSCAHPFPNPSA